MAHPVRPEADLLEVGLVHRPHGVKGEVVVSLVTNRTERLQPGAELQTAGTALKVRRARPFGDRWLVVFEGYADRDAAESLRAAVLYAEPIQDAAELWVHELIGAEVVCAGGSVHGTVRAVQANPASDLLVIDSGALVPLTFVVSVESAGESRRVVVDGPDGLFEPA